MPEHAPANRRRSLFRLRYCAVQLLITAAAHGGSAGHTSHRLTFLSKMYPCLRCARRQARVKLSSRLCLYSTGGGPGRTAELAIDVCDYNIRRFNACRFIIAECQHTDRGSRCALVWTVSLGLSRVVTPPLTCRAGLIVAPHVGTPAGTATREGKVDKPMPSQPVPEGRQDDRLQCRSDGGRVARSSIRMSPCMPANRAWTCVISPGPQALYPTTLIAEWCCSRCWQAKCS